MLWELPSTTREEIFATAKHISLYAQPRGSIMVTRVTEADNFSYKGGGLKLVLVLATSGSSTILIISSVRAVVHSHWFVCEEF